MIGRKLSPVMVEIETALWEFEAHSMGKTVKNPDKFVLLDWEGMVVTDGK